MPEFLGERIEVETGESSPQPVRFRWRGDVFDVAEVVREWVDTGFGATAPASRVWYMRHHRRYYLVRATTGDVFKLYFDYANRKKPTWWLVSRGES